MTLSRGQMMIQLPETKAEAPYLAADAKGSPSTASSCKKNEAADSEEVPDAVRTLLSRFQELDKGVRVLSRRQVPTFFALHGFVSRTSSTDFNKIHLRQILYLYPEAFTVEVRPIKAAVDQKEHQGGQETLIVKVKEDKEALTIAERADKFLSRARQWWRAYASQTHSASCTDDLFPLATLPERSERSLKAEDLLLNGDNGVLNQLGKKQEGARLEVKRPKSSLQDISARISKKRKAREDLQPAIEKCIQQSKLTDLPPFFDRVAGLVRRERRWSFPLQQLASKLAATYTTPITEEELQERLALLAEHSDGWCCLSASKVDPGLQLFQIDSHKDLAQARRALSLAASQEH